jgi:hypothetical protein
LKPVIIMMGTWGQRWLSREIREADLDLRLLMWDMHRRINLSELPPGRTVVQFDFNGARGGRFWLILQQPEAEVCEIDPGMPVDLYVAADAMAMTKVWMGRMDFAAALNSGSIDITGETPLVSGFPRWLALSLFASVG